MKNNKLEIKAILIAAVCTITLMVIIFAAVYYLLKDFVL
jgi:hypothetical protein